MTDTPVAKREEPPKTEAAPQNRPQIHPAKSSVFRELLKKPRSPRKGDLSPDAAMRALTSGTNSRERQLELIDLIKPDSMWRTAAEDWFVRTLCRESLDDCLAYCLTLKPGESRKLGFFNIGVQLHQLEPTQLKVWLEDLAEDDQIGLLNGYANSIIMTQKRVLADHLAEFLRLPCTNAVFDLIPRAVFPTWLKDEGLDGTLTRINDDYRLNPEDAARLKGLLAYNLIEFRGKDWTVDDAADFINGLQLEGRPRDYVIGNVSGYLQDPVNHFIKAMDFALKLTRADDRKAALAATASRLSREPKSDFEFHAALILDSTERAYFYSLSRN